MTDISTEELKKEIELIVKNSDLTKTGVKQVIKQLEKKLGVNLSAKKKLIDQLVMDFVNSMDTDDESEGTDSEEDEKSEEEKVVTKKKPAKKPPKTKKPAKKLSSDEEPEEQDDSNDGDWGKKKRGEDKKKKSEDKKKKRPATKKGGVSKRGKGSGFTRPYKLSPALAELMGEKELPRFEVVKRMSALIKERQLQDPSNRQFTICDKELYNIFGTQRFHTFGMMKYLKHHFLKDE